MAEPMHHLEPPSTVRIPHRRRRFAASALLLGLLGAITLSACATPSDGAPAGPATSQSLPADSPSAATSPPEPDVSADPTAAASPAGSPPAAPSPSVEAPVDPTSVSIPAIGLTEPLIGLGLAEDGTLLVPEDPDEVAWFDGGSRPGEPGPTVIVGHVDSRTGPAVFARLTELAAGDVVEVTSADGSAVSYQVDRVEDVPQDTFPTEAVFGGSPEDQLRLITCTGPWDRVEGYRDNRVVFATAR